MFNAPTAAMPSDCVPSKVQAALNFMQFAEYCRSGGGVDGRQSRDLSKHEEEVYDSALTVMLEYFNEPGVGLPSPMTPPDDGQDKSPVPVS